MPCIHGVDMVVLLWLLVLLMLMLWLLELVLVLHGIVGILFGEDGYNVVGDFLVDGCLVVLSHDIDSEFLYQYEQRDKAEGMR